MTIPKFRAWHKELKKMFDVKSLVITLNLATIASKNDLFPSRTCSFDDIILMQSTGLFDKNGQEIFGNDIVEWKHNGTRRLIRGIVKRDVDFDSWGVQVCRFDDLTPFGHLTNQRVTVLGNIYENPELVEVEK